MIKEASGIAVHCAHDKLVDVVNLIPNPRNPNKHGDKQVAMLAKIIRHQGWRAPARPQPQRPSDHARAGRYRRWPAPRGAQPRRPPAHQGTPLPRRAELTMTFRRFLFATDLHGDMMRAAIYGSPEPLNVGA